MMRPFSTFSVTRLRIFALLGFFLLGMISTGLGWQWQSRRQIQALSAGLQAEKQLSMDNVVVLKTERLRGHIQEISYWDELVSFVARPSLTWAKNNILTGVETAGGEQVHVFDREGKSVYFWHAERRRPLSLNWKPRLQVLEKKRLLHWFEATPNGVWEWHGATIHRSDDSVRRGPYFGYILMGRSWDARTLTALGQLTGSELTFLPLGKKVVAPESSLVTRFPLTDAHGAPVGVLLGSAGNLTQTALEQSLAQAMLLFTAFGSLFLALTLLLLHLWIDKPIFLLAEAMRRRSPEPLGRLRRARSELGELARLVQEFFHQEEILRSSHDELEKRVAQRTEELEHRAFHDSLTGLPNRALLRERLEKATLQVRASGQRIAVLFVDLDNFKVVNDSMGHEAGDALLCTVAQRMLECVRPTDLVARLGGDEFALLLEGLDSPQEINPIVQRLTGALLAPTPLGERSLYTSVSIGVALGDGSESASDLLRNADTAMYHAKVSGKARHAFFDSTMKRKADERLELEADLRQALHSRSKDLYLVFQPIVALDGSQEIIEIEALLRWDHPTHGSISPGHFIPLAEELGLIHELTVWVLEDACRQMARWSRRFPTPQRIRMSVNISAITLQEPDMADWVLGCLERVGLSPGQLVLEITESVLMTHSATITAGLERLRAHGVQVAIDDFGTGYSSMSSLAHLPVDIIKIDQSFIARLDQNPETHAILQAMVDLARAMQLSVVSEGIETVSQRESLQKLGSHYGQGFLFSHPLRADDLEALLAQRLIPLSRAA